MGTQIIQYGRVYADKSGDCVVVYRQGHIWKAETNNFDAERKTKQEIIKQIKDWGYTKYIGLEQI